MENSQASVNRDRAWRGGELRTVKSEGSPVLDLNLMLVSWCLYSSWPQNSVCFNYFPQ